MASLAVLTFAHARHSDDRHARNDAVRLSAVRRQWRRRRRNRVAACGLRRIAAMRRLHQCAMTSVSVWLAKGVTRAPAILRTQFLMVSR